MLGPHDTAGGELGARAGSRVSGTGSSGTGGEQREHIDAEAREVVERVAWYMALAGKPLSDAAVERLAQKAGRARDADPTPTGVTGHRNRGTPRARPAGSTRQKQHHDLP